MRGVSTIAGYLRRHHVGLLALVIALGGTAYAATKLPHKSVGPKQIKTGAVTAKKIRPGAVRSGAVLDGSLSGADIDVSTLQGLDAATLGGQSATALLADQGSFGAASTPTDCNDNNHSPTLANCGAVSIDLKKPGRLLVLLSGSFEAFQLDDPTGPGSGTDDTTSVAGGCGVNLDDKNVVAGTGARVSDEEDTLPLHGVALTDPLDAGAHTLTALCSESDGAIFFNSITVTAVTLEAG